MGTLMDKTSTLSRQICFFSLILRTLYFNTTLSQAPIMKLVVAFVACISLVPGTLSLEVPCKENLTYCGSTLEQWHGMLDPGPIERPKCVFDC
jgi:hypothetical protein